MRRDPRDDRGAEAHWARAIVRAEEVATWLVRLERSATPVTLAGCGGATLGTTVNRVDLRASMLAFDAAPGGVALAELVRSDEVTALAHLDAGRLQFDLDGLTLVHGERADALRAALPARLLHFQRRAAYRVQPDASARPTAHLRHPALPEMQLALRVLDLSTLGCALLLPESVPAVPPGVEIAGARLHLDADTVLQATLQVQHVSAIGPGAGGMRLGCALAGLSSAAAHALQRWIDRTQRRRREFGGG